MHAAHAAEFCLAPGVVHMNHAGLSPWPRRAVLAARAYAADSMRYALREAGRERCIDEVRAGLRRLLGAREDGEIALTKNTSEALSIVAGGLPWRAGDNVVVGRREFSSNRIVWELLARRSGAEIRMVDWPAGEPPEDALLGALDRRTRLLAVSSIQYDDGWRVELPALGEGCRRVGALLCVDAIQSLGGAPFDAQAAGADFVCVGAHKWLLGPEGVGALYCRRELIDTLELRQGGWHMTDDPENYAAAAWTVAPDARRFECGTMNHLGLNVLRASLSLLFEAGPEAVFRAVADKVSYLLERVDRTRYAPLTPDDAARRGGILTLRPLRAEVAQVHKSLLRAGVVCARRAGGVRLAPHFYTPRAALDFVLERLHADPHANP